MTEDTVKVEFKLGQGGKQGFLLVYNAFPIAIGVLALVQILGLGLRAEFTEVLTKILESYDKLVDLTLGWLTPFFQWLGNLVGFVFGFDLMLYPHWKHFFVILLLYYSRDVLGFRNAGHMRGLVYMAPTALFCAISSSIAIGSIAGLEDGWGTLADVVNATIACAWVCAFYAFYGLVRSIVVSSFARYNEKHLGGVDGFWNSVRVRSRGFASDAFSGFAIGSTFSIFVAQFAIGIPAILSVFFIVFLLSVLHISRGWARALDQAQSSVENGEVSAKERIAAFRVNGNAQLGMGIFGMFTAAFFVIVVDAGVGVFGAR